MVYSLTYRRPPHVSASGSSIDEKNKEADGSVKSGRSGISSGIPDALSFDRIVAGGTCPPCTLRDFMNYLVYIEHDAENLQFFLWYQDYSRRFAEIPAGERALSPEWTAAQAANELDPAHPQLKGPKALTPAAAALVKEIDFSRNPRVSVVETKENPFADSPPRTAETFDSNMGTVRSSITSDFASQAKSHVQTAADAFKSADVKLQPFTVQPFRDEINRVIATYLSEGAPRELNISSRDRIAVLRALANTTHPSAFRTIAATVECSLRRQAHPNFIRWTICNGNRPRVVFARCLGVGGITAGFLVATILTLGSAGRGWRALAAFGWFIGISTLVAAWKGMCVVLHGMHHRHLRPWELFDEDYESNSDYELKRASFDSGPSNSYEDAPWVAKYEKRNLVRKIFDRQLWIQEPALRAIQDTIFLQAVLTALVFSAILSAVFVVLPKGYLF